MAPKAGSTGVGTYRVSDGSPIEFLAARTAWVKAARPILGNVARHYNTTITYQELAEEAQEKSGIRTGMPMRHWIGPVLYEVAQDCYHRHEPILTSLCVHSDGTIGDGFAQAIKKTYGEEIGEHDIEYRAAQERFDCYKHCGAAMPLDGGRPTFTKQVAEQRARAQLRKAPPPRPAVCPNCHLVLPLAGHCNNCGWVKPR
jgi:hypothetical protein